MILEENLFDSTNTLEDQLKAIDYVNKVEFDDDGLGQTIILTHFDDSIYDIKGSNYFKVRDKIKKQILQTIRDNGYVMVDPVEDNDTYLYLVYRKKDNLNEKLDIDSFAINLHNSNKNDFEKLQDIESAFITYLNDNDLYPEVWLEKGKLFVIINWGDWKHDHLRLQYLAKEFANAIAVRIEHTDVEITEENGSDTYSAVHTFEIDINELMNDYELEDSVLYHYSDEVYKIGDNITKNYTILPEIKTAYQNKIHMNPEKMVYMLDHTDSDYEATYKYCYKVKADSAIKAAMDFSPLMCQEYLTKHNKKYDPKAVATEFAKIYYRGGTTKNVLNTFGMIKLQNPAEGNEGVDLKYEVVTDKNVIVLEVIKNNNDESHYNEDLTDKMNQQIDDRNANYEADRQATRDMRQELAKQGIATDMEGNPLNESNNHLTLQQFANKIRYNGAAHRDAPIPGEIDIYINQCNIPDNMRIKWLDAEVISDDTIQVQYLTQEDFNPDDAKVFIAEFERAINSMIEYFEFEEVFNISLDIECRSGKEYGYVLKDLTFNQSGDVKADNLKTRIAQTIANIEAMDEEASSYEEQADRCLEKGNEEGYQYYKDHADELRRSIDRAAAYLSSLEEQEEPMNESLLVEDTKFINKEEPDAFITLNDDGTIKETSHGNKIGKKLIEINDTVYFIKQIDENTVHAYSLDEEGQIQKEHPFVFNSEVSKTIDQEDTNNQDGKAEELKAKAEELLTRIKESRDENIWFEVLVPQSGPADSKAGELIRAIERLRYRDYNDGDRFFSGYGLETCASAAAYLMDNGYEYEIEQIMEQELDGQFYSGALDDLFNRITFHIKGNPSLLTEPNEDDMLEWDTSAIKDLTPKYDDSYTIPSEVIDAVESGAFGEESLRWDLESWFESYDDIEVEVDVNNGILYLSNMRKEEYDEINRHIDDWFMQYVEDNAEYFDTDDEYDEEEDEE